MIKARGFFTVSFEKELSVYDTEELHPVGKEILECFKNRGSAEDYCKIIPLGSAVRRQVRRRIKKKITKGGCAQLI